MLGKSGCHDRARTIAPRPYPGAASPIPGTFTLVAANLFMTDPTRRNPPQIVLSRAPRDPAPLATCVSFNPSSNFSRKTSPIRRIAVLEIARSDSERERMIPANSFGRHDTSCVGSRWITPRSTAALRRVEALGCSVIRWIAPSCTVQVRILRLRYAYSECVTIG